MYDVEYYLLNGIDQGEPDWRPVKFVTAGTPIRASRSYIHLH